MFKRSQTLCRGLYYLVSCVLVLGWATSASAELVGHWKLDDGTGLVATDSSGNGNDGTLNGGWQWVSDGMIDGAIDFDGATGYIEIPASASLRVINQGDFTVAAWFKVNDVASNFNLMQQLDAGGTGRTWLFVVDGEIRSFIGGATTASGVSPVAGEWYHAAVVATEGGAADTQQMYVNGLASGQTGQLTAEDCEGGYVISTDKNIGARWVDGLVDDVQFYNHALSEEEMQQAMDGIGTPMATSPSPGDETSDVSREVSLNWTPTELAATRNVYFGTVFEDVNEASTAAPLGVLVSEDQDATSYDPGRLAFDQTYYWRVDEVNGTPDFTVFQGDVWSFTAEPSAVAITGITVTASGSFGTSVAENTINGSGLVDDLHNAAANDMWISTGIPATIEYAFDRAHKLHELWIWNSNQTIESFIGFGAKDVVVEHSLDGENWTVLDGVGPLAQAPGTDGYAHNNTIGFGGVTAQHVRVTINTVHGFAPQTSLSEVRFLSIPTLASRPSPGSGATNVAPDLLLSWGRDGREADRHDVYIGTDVNNLSLAGSVTESSYDTLASDLQLGQTYTWRVDEVNEAMDPSIWPGDVWSFSTVEAIVIDDMESYRDEEFFEIWATWVDGFDDPANGSLVGNGVTGSPETARVRGGGQSLPLHYGDGGAAQSEATRTFDAPMDWTKHGVMSLVLHFEGSPTNTGGNLYVKINGTRVDYDGDAANLTRLGWNRWRLSLADLAGVDLSRVSSMTLGIDGGGQGVVYIDDILLSADARALITPVDPVEGLVAYYPFDGDFQDASGNGRHGTGMGGGLGGPTFGPGQSGQALLLDGAGQYVEITGYQGISAVDGVQQPFSVSNWFATTGDGEMVTWGSSPGGQRLSWRIDVGNLRAEHGNGNIRGNTLVNDGEWHHAALVVQEGANLRVPNTKLYIDGIADGVNAGDDDPYNLTPGEDVSIGRRATSNDRFFPGSIDEVRIFDRALSDGEVAALAGRTEPFDAP